MPVLQNLPQRDSGFTKEFCTYATRITDGTSHDRNQCVRAALLQFFR
jgi:hypothetical protein